MPDQTVKVTFDANAGVQFTFAPDSVTMSAAGKVILQQKAGQSGWTFVTAVVKNDTLNQFTSTTLPGGNMIHINDPVRDRARTSYSYKVTIQTASGPVTSPDPEIVNEPGNAGI